MKRSFKRLLDSVSFRVSIKFGGFIVLTTVLLLAFIYTQTIGALRSEYTRQITASAQRLTIAFMEGQREGLINAIDLTLSDDIDSEREVYLFLDERGNKLAGNLDTLPEIPSGTVESFDTEIRLDGHSKRGQLKVQHFPDGEILFVGHDLEEIEAVSSRIKHAAFTAALAAIVLVGLGTFRLRGELERQISHIRRATQQVGAGQLSKRIPPSLDDDQFTLLTHDINAMLDRIELLMKSARHISDTVAHNIRTPLTRITGRLRAAHHPKATRDELMEANLRAIEAIVSLSSLLGRVLQIAEIEAGVQRQAFTYCELDPIVSDVVDMYGVIADSKGTSLTQRNEENAIVRGDRDMLASVVSNLVDNALKYARTHVAVEVGIANEQWGYIVVRDDGAGIPPEEYENIGKHFYRLDARTTGYGLGLASVRGIVELHNGQLNFSDAHPGLSVEVLIPLAMQQQKEGF